VRLSSAALGIGAIHLTVASLGNWTLPLGNFCRPKSRKPRNFQGNSRRDPAMVQKVRCAQPSVKASDAFSSVAIRLTRADRERVHAAETASLALLEAAHVGFIFRNPTRNLVMGEFSWFRQLGSVRSDAGGEKEHELLFLFRFQRFRRRLNFLKFAHGG
jgi:hypothetical protein